MQSLLLLDDDDDDIQRHGAHAKPAFAPRPSLPSLNTLAQLNMSLPTRKVRKGTPGAHLPHEPWNIDLAPALNPVSLSSDSEPSSAAPSDADHVVTEEDDPLSYHSDFDYYTQSLSDHSDSDSDPDPTSPEHIPPSVTSHSSLYHPDIMRKTTPQHDPRRNTRSPPTYIAGPGGDDNHGHKPPPPNPHSSATSSSSDDDPDLYYSLDGMSNGVPSRTHSSRYSRPPPGSDDDVPLAQRVPTALSAQKSIRQQLHDERQQRRFERAKTSRIADPPPPADPVRMPPVPTTLRKRSISAAQEPRSLPAQPFAVDDLTRKLINLQSFSRTTPRDPPRIPPYSSAVSRSSSRGRHIDLQKTPRVPESTSHDRSLRPMRSFTGRHSESQRQPATEQSATHRLGRSATATASNRPARDAASPPGYSHHPRSADVRKPSASVPRSSVDDERVAQRPPVPPLPVSTSASPQQIARGPVVQQRIFIGDMQRFNIVEISPATNAGGVIDTVASQGMLDKSGSWMLFELAQDYGMERPIRDYELLADVSASWNKDKLLNAFVIKQTPLARLLSHSALPTSSPTHRGWVEWESKRGKWSKRWMELREHGLWLSKRDTGKDEVFLCSLSNFDAYFITRRHKAPKDFVFAIKSTDHLSMFENAADYLHVFSCNPRDGERWMQVILVARSYVLYQERHVLFAKPTEPLAQAKPLARARTRKASVSNRPAQPLVVPPPFNSSPTANVAFEPGSLLAKRKGDA